MSFISSDDLINILREEAMKSIEKTLAMVPTPNRDIAQFIGYSIRDTMAKLYQMGYLPVYMGPPKDITVDFDIYMPRPPFQVTLRW